MFLDHPLICLCFLDIQSEDISTEVNSLQDPNLAALIPEAVELALGSSAGSTVRKYFQGWKRWREWDLSKIGVTVIQAQSLRVALYLAHLVNASLALNQSFSVV